MGLKKELKKQDPLSLADDPVVLCHTLMSKKQDVKDFTESIMNKPKPKPKAESPKDKEKDKTKDKSKEDDKKVNGETKETEKTQPTVGDGLQNDPNMDLGCD